MGGDDLDDDTMLYMHPVRGGGKRNGGEDFDSDDDDYDTNHVLDDYDVNNNSYDVNSDDDNDNDRASSKKRPFEGSTGVETAIGVEAVPSTSRSSSKRKKKKSKQQQHTNDTILIQCGTNIHDQTNIEQAKFITTAVRHYTLLSDSLSKNTEETQQEQQELITILPHHICSFPATDATSSSSSSSTSSIWVSKIRSVVSLKTLREWKHVGSPCIVIVCVSARRAVSLLKEQLASCKVRVGKFFPKNGSIIDQQQQLSTQILPIIIGTPHRLRQLSDNGGDVVGTGGEGGKLGKVGILKWDYTQLVIFDNEEVAPNKQYTVCTLPDTCTDVMLLLRDFIYPQLLLKVQQQQSNANTGGKNNNSSAKGGGGGGGKKKGNCQIAFLK